MRENRLSTALILALLLLAGGCGSQSLVQVSGTITVNDQPADGAVLLFYPESADQSSVSSGVADSNGRFTLVTDGEDGIPVGKYTITVTWPEPSKEPDADIPFSLGETRDRPDLLGNKYISRDRSSLSAVVDKSTTILEPIALTK